MKVSKEKASENRATLIRTAGRLFRERGIDGVGVAEIAREAGLTHGALYAHFPSKEALLAEALSEGMQRGNARIQAANEGKGFTLAELLDYYLSAERRDDPAGGCALAALASEVGRHDLTISARFASGLEQLVAIVETTLAAEMSAAEKHQRATAMTTAMIGGLALARGVAKGNPALADNIILSVRAMVLAAGGQPAGPTAVAGPVR
jgi:TetR/AcrR family transcriptional repressor of nem operon